MRNRLIMTASATVLAAATLFAAGENMPFPQVFNCTNCIKPAVTQGVMNTQVKNIYNDYKNRFIKKINSTNEYYVYSTDTDGNGITISEAHGWGMVIVAQMASNDGQGDDNAREIFDGMVKFYENRKSSNHGSHLMTWTIPSETSAPSKQSASDGDFDIAYGLLIAYKQWGDISYLNKAKAILEDIYLFDIQSVTKHINLGSWASDMYAQVDNRDKAYKYTRPSDWMSDHARTFADATGHAKWDGVADTVYAIYDRFLTQTNSTTGLISDFVYNYGGNTNSVSGKVNETNNDGKYYTNAARVPWHLATDFALWGDSGASADVKPILDKINKWTGDAFGIYPKDAKQGYELDGDAINSNVAGGASYVAPFVAASIAGTNQDFLTNGWNWLNSTNTYDAYQSAIRLQSMLLIAGNHWNYNWEESVPPPPTYDTTGIYLDLFTNTDFQTDMERLNGEHNSSGDTFDTDSMWVAGLGWYEFKEDAADAKVKAGNGDALVDDEWTEKDGEWTMAPGNLTVDGVMDIQLEEGAVFGVNLPNAVDDNKFKTVDKYDLTSMSGITVTAQGPGTVTLTLYNDRNGDKVDTVWFQNYSYDLVLDGTMKDYQIPAELFIPAPFSVESDSSYTWKEIGCKTATGLAFTNPVDETDGSTINLKVDQIKLNGEGIDDNTFGFPIPEFIEEIPGANVLAYSYLGSYVEDPAMGSEVTITTTTEEVTKDDDGTTVVVDSIVSVNVVLDRAAHSGPEMYDAGATFYASFSETTDFSGLISVGITYSSNKDLKFLVPFDDAINLDGETHFVTLPATGGVQKTVTTALAGFKQPVWASPKVEIDLAAVSMFEITLAEESDDAINGEFTITAIKFDGVMVAPDLVATLGETVTKTVGTDIAGVLSSNGIVSVQLNAPVSKNLTMSLVNAQGRIVSRQEMIAGSKSVSFDSKSIASGVYFLTLRGVNVNLQQKLFLK